MAREAKKKKKAVEGNNKYFWAIYLFFFFFFNLFLYFISLQICQYVSHIYYIYLYISQCLALRDSTGLRTESW